MPAAETVARTADRLTHTGVHDHGVRNISTYGNLLCLLLEGRTGSGCSGLR